MKIVLHSITLYNFRGSRKVSLEFSGKDAVIRGQMASGKSTLADAWSWLLTGRDSHGNAKFEIKTLDDSGQPEHHLDHAVTAVLEADGERVELTRTYREVWARKRGTGAEEFTGHETTYSWDGVPVPEKEWNQRLAAWGGPEQLLILTNPYYFCESLEWKDRRRLLCELGHQPTVAEICTGDPDLAAFPAMLGKHSVEDFIASTKAAMRRINLELPQFSARISERSDMPPAPKKSKAVLEKEMATLESVLRGHQESIAHAKADSPILRLTRELEAAKLALTRAVLAEEEKRHEKTGAARKQADDAKRASISMELILQGKKADRNRLEYDLNRAKALWDAAQERSVTVGATKFSASIETICPACERPLEAEKIEKARAKALENFQIEKSRKLEEATAEVDRLAAACSKLEGDLKQLDLAIAEAKNAYDKARYHAEKLASALPSADEPIHCEAEEAAVREAVAKIEAARANPSTAIAELEAKAKETESALASCRADLATHEARRAALKRIEERQAQHKTAGAEYADCERRLLLAEKFQMARIQAIEDSINGLFDYCTWKLFDRQVNGGIAECCEAVYAGVPYRALNTTSQVNVGLDIISALQKKWALALPIFLDGAESYGFIKPMECQAIRLVADGKFETLTMEE